MENRDMFITIHLEDVKPFLDSKDAQKIVLRYLHDLGVECEIGSDEVGPFLRYYRPPDEVFEDFSMKFYHFITSHGK